MQRKEKRKTSEIQYVKENAMNNMHNLQLVFDGTDKVKEKTELTAMEEPKLSPKEQETVDQFAKQIDLHNSNGILKYGSAAQTKMADFSDVALNNVKSKDMGEVGEMLTDVVTQLQSFGTEPSKKRFFLFRKPIDMALRMKTGYDSVATNLGNICTKLEEHQMQLKKDIDVLDGLYEQNLLYFKELSMYIFAGKKKLQEVKGTDLANLREKARISNFPGDAQEVKDLLNLCDRFEKKIHDLEITRMISIQTASQIRLIQNNDIAMVEKIQSTIVNTIPLWKNQMVLSLGIYHAEQAAKAQKEVSDMTNALLRKNAEVLKISSIESAKESERGIVDIETLKDTNVALISTLDEILKIQTEGKEKRKAAEVELQRMEQELKTKLLEY